MAKAPEPKVTYDSTPWHACPSSGQGAALRFKGGAKDGSETACPTCGQRYVYRKPKPSSAPAEQGGRTHF